MPLGRPVGGLCAADMDKFRIRDESRPERRLFGPQGRMRLTGSWAVGADKVHVRSENRSEGCLFGPQGQMPPMGSWIAYERSAWISSYVRRESRKVHPPGLRGQVERARITCNTYSVPYKGKTLKKRLSPKSANTLIHQCITFYIFLIFQYLSLWKSVFSSN